MTARRVLDAESGDVASVQLRFKSGATGYLNAILVTPLYLRLTVFGSAAWVEVRNQSHPDTPGPATLEVARTGAPIEHHRFAWTDTVRANLEAFADAVDGGATYPIGDADKAGNIAVLEALCRSAEHGLPVTLA